MQPEVAAEWLPWLHTTVVMTLVLMHKTTQEAAARFIFHAFNTS